MRDHGVPRAILQVEREKNSTSNSEMRGSSLIWVVLLGKMLRQDTNLTMRTTGCGFEAVGAQKRLLTIVEDMQLWRASLSLSTKAIITCENNSKYKGNRRKTI